MLNPQSIFLILLILTVYSGSPQSFRRRWKRRRPIISSVALAMNSEMDFLRLTTFNLKVFKERIIFPVRSIFERPRHQIIAYIHGNLDSFLRPTMNKKRTILSIEDRFMRALMFWRGCKIQVLEIMFGQKKTTIYDDAWLIIRVLCKAMSSMFELPLKNTQQYQDRVGSGVFAGIIPNAVYIMDGHKVKQLLYFCCEANFFCDTKKIKFIIFGRFKFQSLQSVKENIIQDKRNIIVKIF